jgi:methylisocitrate lyase
MGANIRQQLAGPHGLLAPLVISPLMARLAEAAGFEAGYVGGGALGFVNCGTEANVTLTEMAQLGLAVRAASQLPLILDGICGWGDPMHMRHTIATVEAAGFIAIEIEDQLLPKRAHHHIGIEHVIPIELMAAKIREAVAARRDPDFLIIARTNAARSVGLDDALRRAEALHAAGADLLLVMPGSPDQLPAIAKRLPPPLMYMLPASGIAAIGVTVEDLWSLGFKLVVDPATPLLAMHRALRNAYDALRDRRPDPLVGDEGLFEERHIHELIELERLLEIERGTVEGQPR